MLLFRDTNPTANVDICQGVMFSCEQCEKQYAYLHKLRHHELWLCKGRPSETVILSSPRRTGSRNYFELPITPPPEEGKGDLVTEQHEGKEGSEELEVEGEKSEELDGNTMHLFPCFLCDRSFPSNNTRKKHKRKAHKEQQAQDLVRLWNALHITHCFHYIFRSLVMPLLKKEGMLSKRLSQNH